MYSTKLDFTSFAIRETLDADHLLLEPINNCIHFDINVLPTRDTVTAFSICNTLQILWIGMMVRYASTNLCVRRNFFFIYVAHSATTDRNRFFFLLLFYLSMHTRGHMLCILFSKSFTDVFLSLNISLDVSSQMVWDRVTALSAYAIFPWFRAPFFLFLFSFYFNFFTFIWSKL